jgi:DNA-binding NtrC family response regulator
MSKMVLVVDDDPTQRRLIQGVLEREGFRVAHADGGRAALEHLASGAQTDVVLLDLIMPGMTGQETLADMRARGFTQPVIVVTATGGIDTVVAAMRAGACDFFVKPASPERILVSIANALSMGALRVEVDRLKKHAGGRTTFDDLIGSGPAMQMVKRLGERAAKSSIPVLITGESGAGKEVIARAVHGCSERAGRPFVAVNCGAIPENLVESILFGHEKGSFTGANDKHLGKFQEANGGTLFLDEVGELPLDVQVKLLRALQESEIDPVGAKRPVKVDVRILSATNRDLSLAVSEGRFREDLFYRLNVFPISIPPLRARLCDVPDLAVRFLARFCVEEGKRIRGIASDALALLTTYDWPGNVRQLENAMFRAVVLADGNELTTAEFPQIAAQVEGYDVRIPAAPPPIAADPSAAIVFRPANHEHRDPHSLRMISDSGDVRTLEEIETEIIRFALGHYRGQMSQMARKLGIGRSTLYRKMKDIGIPDDMLGDAAA